MCTKPLQGPSVRLRPIFGRDIIDDRSIKQLDLLLILAFDHPTPLSKLTMLTTFALLSYLTASAFTAKTDLSGCTLTIVPLLTEITTATVDGVVQDVGNYQYSTFLVTTSCTSC